MMGRYLLGVVGFLLGIMLRSRISLSMRRRSRPSLVGTSSSRRLYSRTLLQTAKWLVQSVKSRTNISLPKLSLRLLVQPADIWFNTDFWCKAHQGREAVEVAHCS